MLKSILFFSLAAAAVSAEPRCHNITGTCLRHGFLCISGEVVPHEQRCNGVEDCSDGTDEFLCEHEDHRPLFERSEEERHQFQQATCVNCNCAVTAYNVASSGSFQGWWQYALVTPTSAASIGKACNSECVVMTIGLYKKSRVCRGWLCCARQRQCLSCATGTTRCCGSATAPLRCD